MAYFGTSTIQTTTGKSELIQTNKPSGWTVTISAYIFDFMNLNDCSIKINDGNAIFFPADKGFQIDQTNEPIYKFEIQESGIQYYYIGAYK